jgi:hypothetical protein
MGKSLVRRFPAALLLILAACLSAGCATAFRTEYYLFSGKVVDGKTIVS